MRDDDAALKPHTLKGMLTMLTLIAVYVLTLTTTMFVGIFGGN